jgi:ABC-2 type transport system permease protein
MRWLFVKDVQILRRSPLLVSLLVIYPILIAVLIGFALSRGPDKPKVAFVNLVPKSASEIRLAGEQIDVSRYSDQLFRSIDPVRVACKGETAETCERRAVEKVRNGDVLAALIIPADITSDLQALQNLEATASPTIRVFYNAEDPVKARYVQDTIKSQLQDANTALTKKFTEVALGYLDLIVRGGVFSLPILGTNVNVLGLEKTGAILTAARQRLPAGPIRAELDRVIRFAQLARDNLNVSDRVLGSIGTPIRVKTSIVNGGTTPLSSFAIAIAVTFSLMFVTLLLAAGTLALEREENAFRRLVRGLVSKTGLLVEKAGLSAACSLVVVLIMLAGLSLFVTVDWGRFPQWLAAGSVAALAFAAMGLAIGALAREVRAASLAAFMAAIPIAFLALVPSGSVSGGLYDVIRAISAIFPFKAALDAWGAALNDSGGLGGPLLHLALLTLAFGALGRVGLRRFA